LDDSDTPTWTNRQPSTTFARVPLIPETPEEHHRWNLIIALGIGISIGLAALLIGYLYIRAVLAGDA
jgi:hypothetical protein